MYGSEGEITSGDAANGLSIEVAGVSDFVVATDREVCDPGDLESDTEESSSGGLPLVSSLSVERGYPSQRNPDK